jgi:hypothetical protein
MIYGIRIEANSNRCRWSHNRNIRGDGGKTATLNGEPGTSEPFYFLV